MPRECWIIRFIYSKLNSVGKGNLAAVSAYKMSANDLLASLLAWDVSYCSVSRIRQCILEYFSKLR